MLKPRDRFDFISERKRRGLTQAHMARRLGTTRASMANFESGRTAVPRGELGAGIEKQLDEWKKETLERYGVKQESEFYYSDIECPNCKKETPGPMQGAKFCIHCAYEFRPKTCPRCGNKEQPDSVYCRICRTKLTGF